jgi:hypothetical protein
MILARKLQDSANSDVSPVGGKLISLAFSETVGFNLAKSEPPPLHSGSALRFNEQTGKSFGLAAERLNESRHSPISRGM